MQLHVIIVAGGSGSRMKADVPKQFLILKGKPVLMHTIERFFEYKPEVHCIVVLPQEHIERWSELCNEHSFSLPHQVIAGGKERFFSVLNGLSAVHDSAEALVAVHDGVRPLVSVETIRSCVNKAKISGCAIPVCASKDSVRMVEGHKSEIVDRNKIRLVQTPQIFLCNQLKKAYSTRFQDAFTDDASVYEYSGGKVHLVEGNEENIKITTPTDLKIAEMFLADFIASST